MNDTKVKINRAPVMTLWASVVAERLGYDRPAALTLGKVVAGLNAQSKGQRLGIFEPAGDKDEKKEEKAPARKPGEVYFIDLLGRAVPALTTADGVRAVSKDAPVTPGSVERYLKNKFGDRLDDVRAAMQDLAQSYSPTELARKAYSLYTDFRPQIPEGARGWGAAGTLDVDAIRGLEKK